jgi:chemotaxis protein histidine kinase CheA
VQASSSPAAGSTNLIETLSRLISDLNARLGKNASFHTAINDDDFPQQHREVLHEILIHLGRNSMVHGIESVEERTARGKNPQGLIQLDLKSHPEFHEVIFQDDGRGLDYDKIRIRVGQLGWNLVSDEELRSAIFEPGFSTADKVTELAGRGVGLDIIRHSLQKVGGRILPYSETGAYCAFQILLPKTPLSIA